MKTQGEVLGELGALGVAAPTVEHPAVPTVAAWRAALAALPAEALAPVAGARLCKNLFLKVSAAARPCPGRGGGGGARRAVERPQAAPSTLYLSKRRYGRRGARAADAGGRSHLGRTRTAGCTWWWRWRRRRWT